jgi:hypothetical protein
MLGSTEELWQMPLILNCEKSKDALLTVRKGWRRFSGLITLRPCMSRIHENMKLEKFGIVEELKEKHEKRLAQAQQELKKRMATPRTRFDSYISDVLLFSKWAYRVGKGWYGFSLGDVPRVWVDVLDEFLSWLETERPDFEIHQVKIKGRGLRIYLGTKADLFIPSEKIRSEISQLQNLLIMPQFTQAPIRPPRKKRQVHSRTP